MASVTAGDVVGGGGRDPLDGLAHPDADRFWSAAVVMGFCHSFAASAGLPMFRTAPPSDEPLGKPLSNVGVVDIAAHAGVDRLVGLGGTDAALTGSVIMSRCRVASAWVCLVWHS